MTDKPYILLVTGSRSWRNSELLFAVLDLVIADLPSPLRLIHGGAQGADNLAQTWADSRGIDNQSFPPKYEFYGPGAPIIRNLEMVKLCSGAVAFRGRGKSNGTDSTVERAEAAGKMLLLVHDFWGGK